MKTLTQKEIMLQIGFEHIECSNQYYHRRLGICVGDDMPLDKVHCHVVKEELRRKEDEIKQNIRHALSI